MKGVYNQTWCTHPVDERFGSEGRSGVGCDYHQLILKYERYLIYP
jgi:hypothetical protein